MKFLLYSLLLFLMTIPAFSITDTGKSDSLKTLAQTEFKNEQYGKAVSLLNKALKINKSDPEIYYYLGFCKHYRAYDSRPFTEHSKQYSDSILHYLQKAVELNPDFGNAKYVYGAECSGNALLYMQRNQPDSVKNAYQKAYDFGAYPQWLIEFGKNILNSCAENGILFAGGNPDYDICSYLQIIENYRTDVTVIPAPFINRPWFVKFIKNGMPGIKRKISLNIPDEQISNMHPYKWDTTSVFIPVPEKLKKLFSLPKNYTMDWIVQPDLFTGIPKQNDQSSYQAFLSPQRAVLVSIIESNNWERPIYFSNAGHPKFYGGLNPYFKDCGLISELLPFKTAETEYTADFSKFQQLLKEKNLQHYSGILKEDLPRISGIVFLYHRAAVMLYLKNAKDGSKEESQKIKKLYKDYLLIDFDTQREEMYWKYMNQ